MSITVTTHKKLWGRSGNICAFPDCNMQLVEDVSETKDYSIIGEEAHIIAKKKNGPRGDSELSSEARDEYNNLILLCNRHHKIIDDSPEFYTLEKLHDMKMNHEKAIKENLKLDFKKQTDDEHYASYVDEFIRLANVENWKGWSSFLLGSSQPSISKDQYDALRKLMEYLYSRVWHKRYPKLESSFTNFIKILNDLLYTFDKYSIVDDDFIYTNKFYQIEEWNPALYEDLHQKYLYHIDLIIDLTFELTRAANHIFDSVREHLFPSFRISEGLLLLSVGPGYDMSFKTYKTEYSKQDLKRMYPSLKEFMDIRSSRDVYFRDGVSENYFVNQVYQD